MATKYIFSCLTWLKVVDPRVRMGERTCALEMTWMRKTSASRGRQSFRNARKIRFSPFWLKIRIPDSIVIGGRGEDSCRPNVHTCPYARPEMCICAQERDTTRTFSVFAINWSKIQPLGHLWTFLVDCVFFS